MAQKISIGAQIIVNWFFQAIFHQEICRTLPLTQEALILDNETLVIPSNL